MWILVFIPAINQILMSKIVLENSNTGQQSMQKWAISDKVSNACHPLIMLVC